MSSKILSFFYGIFKREKTFQEKWAEMMPVVMKEAPKLLKILRQQDGNVTMNNVTTDGKVIGMMYDFYQTYWGDVPQGMGAIPIGRDPVGLNDQERAMLIGNTGQWNEAVLTLPAVAAPEVSPQGVVLKRDQKISAKPVDVMKELEDIPSPVKMEELDTKIALFQDKTNLANQHYVKAQLDGVVKRLENRKNYGPHVDFFVQYPNTSDEKIGALLAKYKLVMKKSDVFVPVFPKEAIDAMKKYTEVCKKVSGELPVFYVIAEEQDFKKKYERLDPILLVQSPFGFYWQILGAWDKEMLLLSEL